MSISVSMIADHEVEAIISANIPEFMECLEDVFRKRIEGNVLLPDKISQIFDEKTQNRINCMPASILDERVSGVKLVSVFPQNPSEGYLNVTGQIMLSEIRHGYPIAYMSGTYLTAFRTAALGAIASKYLAKKICPTIGFIGSGQQARMHFRMIHQVHPEITHCFVSSIDDYSANSFVEEFTAEYPHVIFHSCGSDYKSAVLDADIIVTAISAQDPILKADWVRKGTLYIHVGGLEDDYGVPEKADKIICDEWEAVKHRSQTISRMYKAGKLQDSDIYCNIAEIITNQKPGRENDEEFIYFNSVGLGYVDIYVAYHAYLKAVEKNIGKRVDL